MDEASYEGVRTCIQAIAVRSGYDLVRVLVFGSRARGDHRADSDIDVILVSPDFEDVPFYRRSGPFYREWDYEELPSPEFVPLTPAEFDERMSAGSPTVVQTAVREGVDIMT
jgi:predicted nucleotidyltransferase